MICDKNNSHNTLVATVSVRIFWQTAADRRECVCLCITATVFRVSCNRIVYFVGMGRKRERDKTVEQELSICGVDSTKAGDTQKQNERKSNFVERLFDLGKRKNDLKMK